MSRPKDGSRSKVLAALKNEGALQLAAMTIPHSNISHDWFTSGRHTRKILNSSWFKKTYAERFNKRPGLWISAIEVNDAGSQPCGATVLGNGNVSKLYVAVPLTNSATRRLDVLHGIAHLLQPDDSALHGAEFCRLLLDMAGRYGFMTTDRAVDKKALAAVFRDNKIKSRVVSEEARERARQRYQDVHVAGLKDNLTALWKELNDE